MRLLIKRNSRVVWQQGLGQACMIKGSAALLACMLALVHSAGHPSSLDAGQKRKLHARPLRAHVSTSSKNGMNCTSFRLWPGRSSPHAYVICKYVFSISAVWLCCCLCHLVQWCAFYCFCTAHTLASAWGMGAPPPASEPLHLQPSNGAIKICWMLWKIGMSVRKVCTAVMHSCPFRCSIFWEFVHLHCALLGSLHASARPLVLSAMHSVQGCPPMCGTTRRIRALRCGMSSVFIHSSLGKLGLGVRVGY